MLFVCNLDCSVPVLLGPLPHRTIAMSTGEAEETQSVNGDGGAGGPGAPTPLSVLEVIEDYSENLQCELED